MYGIIILTVKASFPSHSPFFCHLLCILPRYFNTDRSYPLHCPGFGVEEIFVEGMGKDLCRGQTATRLHPQ